MLRAGGHEPRSKTVGGKIALKSRMSGEPLHKPSDVPAVDPILLQRAADRKRTENGTGGDPGHLEPFTKRVHGTDRLSSQLRDCDFPAGTDLIGFRSSKRNNRALFFEAYVSDVERRYFGSPKPASECQQKERPVPATTETRIKAMEDVFEQLGGQRGFPVRRDAVRPLDAFEDLTHDRVCGRARKAEKLVMLRDRDDAPAHGCDFSFSGELGEVERDGLWRRRQRCEVTCFAELLEIA